MANSLSNSRINESSRNNSSALRSLLLFFIFYFSFFTLNAQSHFNKLYSLRSAAVSFQSIAPQGEDGGFMTSATYIDSVTKELGIRINRFSKEGIEEKSVFFNIPEYPSRYAVTSIKALSRINDNRFVLAANIYVPGYEGTKYSFLLLTDSACNILHYKKFANNNPPGTTLADTFLYTSSVKYDGLGNLITCSHSLFVGDTIKLMVHKFDTSLNLLWVKSYSPNNYMKNASCFDLIVTASGYYIGGSIRFPGAALYDHYRSSSIILAVDTSGVEKWTYRSPCTTLTQSQNAITTFLHTMDGGYLYATCGHVYNVWPEAAKPGIDLAGKTIIVKLDAMRNKIWEIEIDKYYGNYALSDYKLMELSDSSFLYCGAIITDSAAPNYVSGGFYLNHYSKDGSLMYSHILKAPRDMTDTSAGSAGVIYDMFQSADKGLVLSGFYYNGTIGAAMPAQRGWIIKLDSNGCEGPGDAQCWPLSIVKFQAENALAKAAFSLSPNPTNGILNIVYFGESDNATDINVCDITGRKVLSDKINFQPGVSQEINISKVATGIYFVNITNASGKTEVFKVVKQ